MSTYNVVGLTMLAVLLMFFVGWAVYLGGWAMLLPLGIGVLIAAHALFALYLLSL